MKWTDASSWRRGEDRTEPKTWQAKAAWCLITVTRHIHIPGAWCLRVHDLGIDLVQLSAKEADAAKDEAAEIVRQRLEAALNALKPSRRHAEGES